MALEDERSERVDDLIAEESASVLSHITLFTCLLNPRPKEMETN